MTQTRTKAVTSAKTMPATVSHSLCWRKFVNQAIPPNSQVAVDAQHVRSGRNNQDQRLGPLPNPQDGEFLNAIFLPLDSKQKDNYENDDQ